GLWVLLISAPGGMAPGGSGPGLAHTPGEAGERATARGPRAAGTMTGWSGEGVLPNANYFGASLVPSSAWPGRPVSAVTPSAPTPAEARPSPALDMESVDAFFAAGAGMAKRSPLSGRVSVGPGAVDATAVDGFEMVIDDLGAYWS